MTQTLRRTAAATLFLATVLGAASLGTTAHAATGPAGGHSFNTGVEIRAGARLQQQLTVGDFLFWRITLKRGQRLTVQASVDVPGGYNPGASPHYERLGVRIYDTVRRPLLCDRTDGTEMIYAGHATAESGGRFTARCTVGTLDYQATDQAGTYYVQAGIGGATLTRGTALPLTVTVATGTGATPRPVEKWDPGTPAGKVPSTRPPAASPSSASSSAASSSSAEAAAPAPFRSAAKDRSALAADSDRFPSWLLVTGALVAGAVIMLAFGRLRRQR